MVLKRPEAQTARGGLCSKKMLSVCPSLALLTSLTLAPSTLPPTCILDPTSAGRAHHRAQVATMARVYADVNQNMPRSYWDYDSVNIGQPLRFLFLFSHLPRRRPAIPARESSAILGGRADHHNEHASLTPSQAGASWKTTRS